MLKNLWLALSLILALSAVLLLSDLPGKQPSGAQNKKEFPSIAIMQIASTTLLDNHVAGVISRLKEAGHYAPDGSNVRMFNAQGDFAMANTIAREIVNGPYDLVITSSTLALQTFAKANQSTGKPHVFGAVTYPFGAGVGITGTEPDDHPPHLTGIGSFQPVTKTFRILKSLNPGIRRVGVVWNPGEQCSEACLTEARVICKELDIELVEAIATNTSEVSEAARSLVSKKVEAVWIGGDSVALASAGLIIGIGESAGIPVFTNDPVDTGIGALFGLGANYFTVGQYTADMAIAILEGASPASFRIENVVPERFTLNQDLLKKLPPSWSLSTEIARRLEEEALGNMDEKVSINYKARIAVINLVENPTLDEARRGLEEGLQESGLNPGEHYELKYFSAQGDMSALPQIIDAAIRDRPDAIVTITTPALMAAVPKIKSIPLIFTVASDPEVLHLFPQGRPSNICGYFDDPPLDEVLQMADKHIKGLKKAGIIYDAAQENALISVRKLREAGRLMNIEILEATASSVNDLTLASQSLIQRGAQTLILSADNLVATGFNVILRETSKAGIPVFSTDMEMVRQGASGGIGYSFFEWGRYSGRLTARVLAGTSPSLLPISALPVTNRVEPNQKIAATRAAGPYKLRLVQYSDTEFAERCYEGFIDGLHRAGLTEGSGYLLRTYNAQGDIATLSSIMTTIKSDKPDLLIVISTPTLQAALRQAGSEIPIVFSCVGDGVQAGAGKSETDHLPNVTGITTRSPFEGMARLIRETLPGTKKVGTLFTPSEVNSVLYKNWFAEALKKEGIELVSIPVTAVADVPQAATDLCGQDIQVLAQVVDNFTRPGFALIARKASEKRIPAFVFDSDQMKDGGTLCLARDYYDAGLEAAEKAVRVLAGESPGNIPFNNTKSEKLLINKELAKKYGLAISANLLNKAEEYTPTNK